MDFDESKTLIEIRIKVEEVNSETLGNENPISELSETFFNKINNERSDTKNVICDPFNSTEFEDIIPVNSETIMKSSESNEITPLTSLKSLVEYVKREIEDEELQATYLDGVLLKNSDIQHNMEDLVRKGTLHDEENINIKTEIAEQSKTIDYKLLQYPIVYTKKLDDMNVFMTNNYTFVKGKHKIDTILIESKPIKKIITKIENSLNTPELEDISLNKCSIANSPEPNPEPVKYSNWLLNKPKNCSFNGIKLKNHPDFNEKLRGISRRFSLLPRNRRLLKQCIPVTVDLYRGLDKILVNKTLCLTNLLGSTQDNNSTSISTEDKESSNSCSKINAREVEMKELNNINNPVLIVNVEQCSGSSNITAKAHIAVKEPADEVAIRKRTINPRNTYIYFRKKAHSEGIIPSDTVASENQNKHNYDESIKKLLLLTNEDIKSNLPKSPIYFGDNNILLCLFKKTDFNSTVINNQNIWKRIPDGVQIILMQDRQISLNIDTGGSLNTSHLSTLPEIIACIQKELISSNIIPKYSPGNMLTANNHNIRENETGVVNKNKPLLQDPIIQLAVKNFPALYIVISTHLEMAYASENNAMFYKLNTVSGVIKPVSISLKKQPRLNNVIAECNNNLSENTLNEKRNPIQFYEAVNSCTNKDGKRVLLQPVKSGCVIPPGFNGKKVIKIVHFTAKSANC